MVGYVPQEIVLFHDSVLANLTLGDPALTPRQAIEALETAGAWSFVASLKRRPDDHGRRTRHAALGRPAAADRAGPRTAGQAQAPDPRRGDQRARPGDRGRDLRQRPGARRQASRSSRSPIGRPGSTSPTGSTRSRRAACAWSATRRRTWPCCHRVTDRRRGRGAPRRSRPGAAQHHDDRPADVRQEDDHLLWALTTSSLGRLASCRVWSAWHRPTISLAQQR